MTYKEAMDILDQDADINSTTFILLANKGDKEGAINFIMSKTGCDETVAKAIYLDLSDGLPVYQEVNINNIPQNIPKCPTCGSTDLKRISTTSKLVNTAVWGLFGTKRNKTFHCNNCKYEW